MEQSDSFWARGAYWMFMTIAVGVLAESFLTQPASDRPFYLVIAGAISLVQVLLLWLRHESAGLSVPQIFCGITFANSPFKGQPASFHTALAISRAILIGLSVMLFSLPYLL